jgi:hypothetical protein
MKYKAQYAGEELIEIRLGLRPRVLQHLKQHTAQKLQLRLDAVKPRDVAKWINDSLPAQLMPVDLTHSFIYAYKRWAAIYGGT